MKAYRFKSDHTAVYKKAENEFSEEKDIII